MAATVAGLLTYLGISPASAVDEDAMAAAVAAANDWVPTQRPDLTLDSEGVPVDPWPARVDQAALVYAARLYGRRGSTMGAAAFADLGVVMIARMDPEVRALLELGEYQPNVVA